MTDWLPRVTIITLVTLGVVASPFILDWIEAQLCSDRCTMNRESRLEKHDNH